MQASHRIVLGAILAWALVMIVPDLWRVAEPLGSFGFYADNDGRIYDVTGPFEGPSRSPAWQAGIRTGDRLDFSRMRCIPYEVRICGDLLAVVGGLQFVLPGRSATIALAATPETPARQVTVVAEQRTTNVLNKGILILSQLAGIAVVLAAAWLVWTRPGPMSWGFFLYIVVQSGAGVPVLCLAAAMAAAVPAESADRSPKRPAMPGSSRAAGSRRSAGSRWRPVERLVPLIGVALALALAASYGDLRLPHRARNPCRHLRRLIIDIAALSIVIARRRKETPENQQRLNWVIAGCLIGVPASIIAELGMTTTIFETPFGDFTPTEDIVGLLYLVNGVLCLFVFEAVRRKRVVNVAIPLRRVTILGLTLSIPALVLHHQIDRIEEQFELPSWAWLVVGSVVLFLLSRLHELGVELADHFFNRRLDEAAHMLEDALFKARAPSDIERVLVDEPMCRLSLGSAAVFRKSGAIF
jgi:hypothetical protein